MEPDFSKYSESELVNCLKVIDKVQFPDRVNAIEKRLQLLQSENLEQRKAAPVVDIDNGSSTTLARIGFTLMFALMVLVTLNAIFNGEIATRFNTPVSAGENPILFSLVLCVYVGLTIVLGWSSYHYWFKHERT